MKIMDFIFILLLFLYAVNFQGRFEQIGVGILILSGVSMVAKRYIKKSWQSVFVILFLFIYCLKVGLGLGENVYAKILQFGGMYMFGTFLCEKYLDKNDHHSLFRLIFWGAAGFGVYGVLCSFGMGGIIGANQRIRDFWAQSDVIASTQVSAWIVTFLAIIPWVILQFNKLSPVYKVITIVLGVLSSVSIFFLASRTSLLVLILAIILTLYGLVKGKHRKILNRIVILMFIVFLAFQMNVGGIQDRLLESNLIVRLSIKAESGGAFQTSRTTRWLYFFSHWSECLTGDYYFSNRIGAQLHSALFDLYDQAGMLPFILLLLIVSRVIYTLFQIRKRDDDIVFIRGFQIWFLLMSFVLFTEPVWYYGRAQYIAFVFFMLGIFEHYWLWARGKVIRKDE